MSGRRLSDWIDTASQRLRTSGIEEARQEARLLVQMAFGLSAAELIGREHDTPEDARACWLLQTYIDRRAAREPLAHIAGWRSFYGLDFHCDARALVPRPETEALVEAALEKLPADREAFIADLGTGSGCLLAAILKTRPLAKGVGVEREADACALARLNIAHHGLGAVADILETDWGAWSGWSDADLIVANPPYIASDVLLELEPEVRQFDPLTALDGGADGLASYRALVDLGARQMKPGGWLLLEIGYDQGARVPDLLQEAGFVDIELRRDLNQHPRIVIARRP